MAKFNFDEQMKKISAQPGRVFGLLYPYVFVIGLALGLYYLANINEITRRKVTPKLVDSAALVHDLKVVEARTVPPLDIMTVSQPTPELMNQGANLYSTACASCHGADGNGNGPAASGLNPPPKNFLVDEGWKNGASIPGIYQTLTEGIPNSGMIAFDYFTPEERIAMTHYVREAFVPNPPASSEGELQTMEATYNLSAGAEIPAQIPVASAMNIILRETSVSVSEITGVVHSILREDNEGARIFDRVTNNNIVVVNLFRNSDEWREDKESFIRFVTRNTGRSLFNRNVYFLNAGEWDEFYNLMIENL
jgi:mono/diheme cytochrome c family protein